MSAWKKLIKQNIKVKYTKKTGRIDKTKSRTIKDDKWERKKYLEHCKGDIVKEIKIRLHVKPEKELYVIIMSHTNSRENLHSRVRLNVKELLA